MPTALLGPQRLQPTIGVVADDLAVDGRVGVVTAGWVEREGEDEELVAALGRSAVNLRLYERAEDVHEADDELAAAARERDLRLARLQEIYRMRLAHALDAARELMRRGDDDDDPDLTRAIRAAIQSVSWLDTHHLETVREVIGDYDASISLDTRPSVVDARRALADEIAQCSAVAIAGGNVGTLLRVARLLELGAVLDGRTVIAWSAGAMLLARRVVLFHDTPPQGAGNAEVLAPGLDRAGRLLPLPSARRRLRLDDPLRVALFAQRFADQLCVAMDEGDRVTLDAHAWRAPAGTRLLSRTGEVIEMAGDDR